MNRIKTGDIVRAFKKIWPHMTGDMVRKAEQSQMIRAIRSPFSERSGLFYDPDSVESFVQTQVMQKEITTDQAKIVLTELGINQTQLRLIRPIAL
jgi:hypothetical protein